MITLGKMAAILELAIVTMDRHQARAMEECAVLIEDEAKRVLGTHDYGWPPLAPATLARKAANTPGLETGEMRDSVQHVSSKNELSVGSDNDKAVWFELGTSRGQPPRPFLSGAVVHKMPEIQQLIGKVVVRALSP